MFHCPKGLPKLIAENKLDSNIILLGIRHKKNFRIFLNNFAIFGDFFVLSSAKKIGRPILGNLPTYHVPFLSYHAKPTYLPKNGMSLMDVPKSDFKSDSQIKFM